MFYCCQVIWSLTNLGVGWTAPGRKARQYRDPRYAEAESGTVFQGLWEDGLLVGKTYCQSGPGSKEKYLGKKIK